MGDETYSGVVSTEADVPISHTRKQDVALVLLDHLPRPRAGRGRGRGRHQAVTPQADAAQAEAGGSSSAPHRPAALAAREGGPPRRGVMTGRGQRFKEAWRSLGPAGGATSPGSASPSARPARWRSIDATKSDVSGSATRTTPARSPRAQTRGAARRRLAAPGETRRSPESARPARRRRRPRQRRRRDLAGSDGAGKLID